MLLRHVALHPAIDRDSIWHRQERVVRDHDHAPRALDRATGDSRHPANTEQLAAKPVPRHIEGHRRIGRLVEVPPADKTGGRRGGRDSSRQQRPQFVTAGERCPRSRVVGPEAYVVRKEIDVVGLFRGEHVAHGVEITEAILP